MSQDRYDAKEIKLAQLPHQLFVFNAVGNHVLLTVITISVAISSPLWTLIIPTISLCILAYSLIRGSTLTKHPSMLVRCHWSIVVRRSKIFLIAYAILATAATLAWALFAYAGAMKELMFALVGGLGLLPFMVTVLALTIMESEALSHAGNGYVPDSFIRRWGTDEEKAMLEQEAQSA